MQYQKPPEILATKKVKTGTLILIRENSGSKPKWVWEKKNKNLPDNWESFLSR